MNDLNLRTYNNANVVKWYQEMESITSVEKLIFDINSNILSSGSVLDIGIGGGRTTAYLFRKCKTYTGIDYSENFVSASKKKFANADIRLADARDLSVFKNNTFDVVNFSFNGIDYVNLKDREKILSEINRVLKPNGVFLFSTHNLCHETFNKQPWLYKENSFFTNLKTFLKLLPFLPRHISKKKEEFYSKDYAIINDSAHDYSLLTFYTAPSFIKQQLQQSEFTAIEFYSKDAKQENETHLDDWIFISCKKLPA